MSEPTYRIELEHDAATPTEYKWNWFLYRVSDALLVANGYATTTDKASEQACEAITRLRDEQPSVTLYATEDGEIVPAPPLRSVPA